jgi:hypothetical protein
MPTTRYTVYARSESLNQRVRVFDLEHVDRELTLEQAEQAAKYFALKQRQDRYMNASDWQPLVELEQHGIDTLPGYIG